MIFPKELKEGDTIKIISPSNGIKEKDINILENAIKYLSDKGFKIKEDKYVRQSINGASANVKNRANELNKSINDTSINALIASSGGDFLVQIFKYLKLNQITKNIKWIQGHSDITNLLYYITTKYDIATIYSFNIKAFGKTSFLPNEMLDNNIKLLKGEEIEQCDYNCRIDEENKIYSKWEAITKFYPVKGRIIGGCIECLKDLIGTKYDYTKKFIKKYEEDGIIWYFDVFEMSNEDILRTMWQFKNAGWFKNTKCILFGRLYEEKTYTNLSLKDSILSELDLDIPIIINVDIGHTYPTVSIINGSIVEITYDNDKFKITNYLKK